MRLYSARTLRVPFLLVRDVLRRVEAVEGTAESDIEVRRDDSSGVVLEADHSDTRVSLAFLARAPIAGREVVEVPGTKVVVVVGLGAGEEEGRILLLGGVTDMKETDGAASRTRERRERSTLPPSGRRGEEEGDGTIAFAFGGAVMGQMRSEKRHTIVQNSWGLTCFGSD